MILILAGAASGQERPLPKELAAVAFDQRPGALVPLDAVYRDENDQTVKLGDLLQGKPAILVLGYQRCPRLCSMVLQNLVNRLRKVPFDVGKDFAVIDVSIDPEESTEISRATKESCLERYGRPGAGTGWRFLTGPEGEVRRLADAVGFRYRWDPKHREYQHPAGIILLTPDGRVARYLFGADYPALDLRLGLVEASQGKIAATAERALLLTCLRYDPASGRYTLAAWQLMRAAGIVTVLVLAGYVLWSWRRERRAALHPPTAS